MRDQVARRSADEKPPWRGAAEFLLVGILAATPLAVAFHYRWGELVLPLASLPGLALLWGSLDLRRGLRADLALSGATTTRLTCFACIAWMALSPVWSPVPRFAAVGVLKALVTIGMAAALGSLLRQIRNDRVFAQLAAFTACASCLLIFGWVTQGGVHRAVGCCRAGIQPILSGAAVSLALFVWPCAAWLAFRRRRMLAIGMLGLAGLAVAGSRSGAACLAFSGGTAALLLSKRFPRAGMALPFALALSAVVVLPFLPGALELLDKSGLLDPLKGLHARERAEIWSHYLQLIAARPWFGYGLRAEQMIFGSASTAALAAPREAALHPHNLALQVVFDFGVLGTALALASVAAVTKHLYDLRSDRSPFAVAAAVAFLFGTLVNFGLWEWWWLAVASIAFVLTGQMLGPAVQGSPERPDGGAQDAATRLRSSATAWNGTPGCGAGLRPAAEP